MARKFKILVRRKGYIHPIYRKFSLHCYAHSLILSFTHKQIMDSKIHPYGKVIYGDHDEVYLQWDSEEHHTWFILRWS